MIAPVQVLLVEDSPSDARLAQQALAESDVPFELNHAERLSAALELLNTRYFDVVLLDLGLPDSQGLSTLLKLHTSNADVPIVVMTATDIEKLGLLAVRRGAQDYVVKGRLPGDLLARTIRYAIERNASAKVLRERTALASLSADIGAAFTEGRNQQQTLQHCAESIVEKLGVSFAGIWTVDATNGVLELQASAGTSPPGDETPSRLKMGQSWIGRIAADQKSDLGDGVLGDSGEGAPRAARSASSAAFAGYPLLMGSVTIGVLALFARRPLSPLVHETVASLANHIALGLDRIRAEEARRREEAKWKAMSESNLLGVITWSTDGRVLDANDTFLRKVGYSREELDAGQVRWNELTPPEYRHLDENSIVEIRATGRSTPFEKEFIIRDGSRLPILIGSASLPGEDEGGIAIIFDRTEIKKSEEANYTLQAIMEGADHAIIGTTLDGIILAWNPGAERLYGYAFDEVVDKHISIITPPQQADELWDILDAVRGGERALSIETVRRHRTGELIHVAISLTPVRNKAGQIIAVTSIDQDISDKRRLEEQFRQSQKMEAVGQLAAGVAHDFNNLLTVISGFSDVILANEQLDERTSQLVDEIKKAGKRGESLTRQLLAFGRKTVLAPKVLSLNDVMSDSIRMLRRLVGEHIEITTELAPDLDNVQVDPNQIEHAIINLTVNARDAMPTGGKLRIETGVEMVDKNAPLHPKIKPGRYVTLTISDTGCGMDQETTARIFEPFFTTKEIGKGTGLGLPAVCGIIEQSGGHVRVASQLGRGTTFKLYLPASGKPIAVPKQLQDSKTACRGNEIILLVEDDNAVRMIARVALQMHGYTVLEASDGEQAMEIWQQHRERIQLLVTDVVMPGLSGREVAERLRAQNPAIEVLYLSGYNEDAVVRQSALEGTAFLQKPFNSTALASKVRELLDRSSPLV